MAALPRGAVKLVLTCHQFFSYFLDAAQEGVREMLKGLEGILVADWHGTRGALDHPSLV